MTDPATGTITDWDEDTWHKFHTWLDDVLRGNVVELIFTKADGSQRVMNCTKKYDVIDAGIKSKNISSEVDVTRVKRKPYKSTANSITVWDTDINDWRSFRVKNLTNILTICIKYGPIK